MRPVHFEEEEEETHMRKLKKTKTQCQTASRPAAPGRAVTVLLGAPSQSDVAGDAWQVLCVLTGDCR